MSNNFSYGEEMGYVNIHGQDVKVYVCEKTGRILIPIDELKDMGFRIYPKSQYSRLLIDETQFNKEFNLYMLQSAQTYMLENRIGFKENEILESINKCKAKLTGGSPTSPPTDSARNPNPDPKTNFLKNHVTVSSPTDIRVTANLREPSSATIQSLSQEKPFKTFTQARSANTDRRSQDFEQKSPPRNDLGQRNRDNFAQRNQDNFKPRNSFEQRTMNEPKAFTKPESSSFGRSPRESQENLASRRPNGQESSQKEFDNEIPERPRLIELNKPEHDVLVSHIDKPNVIWVQDMDNVETLLDIDSKIREDVPKQATKSGGRFVLNKIYLAEEDDCWYRCKIIKFKPLTAFFIDYGNTAEVNEFKEASEELAKIPCQAAKITFLESQYKPENFEKIRIKIKKRFDNGTYQVDVVKTGNEPAPPTVETPPTSTKTLPAPSKPLPAPSKPLPTPSIKTFFTGPPQPPCKLENGQRVMLFSHFGPKLALRTRECFESLKKISISLENFEAKPVEKVEKGQLVLCKKGKLQRALILNVKAKSAEIKFLDYCETAEVDLSSLYHINESLAKEPLTYILSPPIKGHNEASEEILNELIKPEPKGNVVLSNGDFDLKIGTELLSEKLALSNDPDRPLIKNFDFYKPDLGVGEYMLNVYRNINELYFASSEALEKYISTIIRTELNDGTPYEPVVGEVCFGLYQDSWSRCVVLCQRNSGYDVQFIDFGNLDFLKSEQLGKLTEDVMKTPILGFRCELTGLPDVKNIESLLKANITEGDNYEVNIKKNNGDTYAIEIPSLYEKLKESI